MGFLWEVAPSDSTWLATGHLYVPSALCSLTEVKFRVRGRVGVRVLVGWWLGWG